MNLTPYLDGDQVDALDRGACLGDFGGQQIEHIHTRHGDDGYLADGFHTGHFDTLRVGAHEVAQRRDTVDDRDGCQRDQRVFEHGHSLFLSGFWFRVGRYAAFPPVNVCRGGR